MSLNFNEDLDSKNHIKADDNFGKLNYSCKTIWTSIYSWTHSI